MIRRLEGGPLSRGHCLTRRSAIDAGGGKVRTRHKKAPDDAGAFELLI